MPGCVPSRFVRCLGCCIASLGQVLPWVRPQVGLFALCEFVYRACAFPRPKVFRSPLRILAPGHSYEFVAPKEKVRPKGLSCAFLVGCAAVLSWPALPSWLHDLHSRRSFLASLSRAMRLTLSPDRRSCSDSVQPASKLAKASSQLRPTFSASVATLQLGIDAASLRAASCPHTTWLPGQHIIALSLHPLQYLYFGRCRCPGVRLSRPYSVSAVYHAWW